MEQVDTGGRGSLASRTPDRDSKRQWLMIVLVIAGSILTGVLIDVVDHARNPENARPARIAVPTSIPDPASMN